MANGLGFYALAGGLAGAGSGLAEQGRRDFQAMQEELRAKRAAEEAQKGRDFTAGENRLNREQQTTLQTDRQTFQEGQNDLDRRQREKITGMTTGAARDRDNAAAGRYTQFDVDEDGYKIGLNANGRWERVTNEKGEPYKPKTTPKKDPTELTAAERAKIILDAQKNNTSTNELTGKQEFNEEGYRRALRAVGIEPVGDAAPKAAATEALPAPRDPSQRKVGQVYVGAGGRKAEWTGSGWRPVE
jgi:hypothetical protein